MSDNQQSDDMLAQSVIDGLSETMAVERARRVYALVGGGGALAAFAGLFLVRHHTRPQLVAAVVGAALALVAFVLSRHSAVALGLSAVMWAMFALQLEPGPLLMANGFDCAMVEALAFVMGTLPFVIVTAVNKDAPSPMRFAVLATAANAMAGAALHVACEASANAPHFLAFHFSPSVLCAAIAFVAAARWRRSSLSA